MYISYPNLELLEYRAKLCLMTLDDDKYKLTNTELTADVFLQTWGSTALGFDGIGGQMMTSAYTTVFQDEILNVAVVFFDYNLAYIIENVNDKFIEDLKNRNMCRVSESNKYGDRRYVKDVK